MIRKSGHRFSEKHAVGLDPRDHAQTIETYLEGANTMALLRRQSLVKFDAPLCETIVDTPKPVAKEVLVRIERCGLCHSDLHIQDGYADLGGGKKLDTTRGMTLPFTLGHEIAGVVMMGLSFAQAMFQQKISVADLSSAARDTALKNGAAFAYDPAEPDVVKRMIKETEGGFDEIVDFAGNEKSMAFAVSVVARGGKIVVSGLMGGNFSLPMVQWVYKRMTIEGFMVGTLAEGKELMALARSGKIKPTPMREEPMGDVQKWIDELRAGKVVGRIVLKN